MITTGDLKYNPATNHYEPIDPNSAIPPFIPSAGDPEAGAGSAIPMAMTPETRALHLEELARQGLPPPPPPPGGQHLLTTETYVDSPRAELVEEPLVLELSDLGELVQEDDEEPTAKSGE